MDASLENFVEEDLGGVTENSHNEEPVEETNFEEHHGEPVEDTILEEHEEEAVNETDLEAHDEEQVKDMKLEAPNEEPGKDNNSVPRVGEKRWPGWPGESVFRILIPAHKVGAIIGRKGEFIKKMCEESKARIKILDGPPGIPERAVMSADLRQEIQSSLSSQNRRTEYSSQRSVIEHQCCKFVLSPSNLCWMKILAKKLQMLPGNSITCLSDSFDTWTKLLIKIGTTKMFQEKIQEQFDCNKWRKRPSENAIP